MGSLLLPRRRLLNPRMVPTVPVRVIEDHPLAQGLQCVYLPGLSGADLAGKQSPLIPFGGAALIVAGTSTGPGRQTAIAPSSSTGLITASPLGPISFAVGATVWCCRTVSAPPTTNFPWIVSLESAADNHHTLALYTDLNGTNYNLYADGSFFGTFGSTVSPALQTNAVTVAIGGLSYGYYNGAQSPNSYTSPSTLGYDGTVDCFWVGQGGNDTHIADAVWNVPLTPAQIAELAAAPFSMLEPISGPLWFPVSSGSLINLTAYLGFGGEALTQATAQGALTAESLSDLAAAGPTFGEWLAQQKSSDVVAGDWLARVAAQERAGGEVTAQGAAPGGFAGESLTRGAADAGFSTEGLLAATAVAALSTESLMQGLAIAALSAESLAGGIATAALSADWTASMTALVAHDGVVLESLAIGSATGPLSSDALTGGVALSAFGADWTSGLTALVSYGGFAVESAAEGTATSTLSSDALIRQASSTALTADTTVQGAATSVLGIEAIHQGAATSPLPSDALTGGVAIATVFADWTANLTAQVAYSGLLADVLAGGAAMDGFALDWGAPAHLSIPVLVSFTIGSDIPEPLPVTPPQPGGVLVSMATPYGPPAV